MRITARNIATDYVPQSGSGVRPIVGGEANLLEILPVLANSPEGIVDVDFSGSEKDSNISGSISSQKYLEFLSSLMPQDNDTSVLVLSCMPDNYSASEISRAVEDLDTRVLGLWTFTEDDGSLSIFLRIGRRDSLEIARNLQRYGYEVIYMNKSSREEEMQDERLAALRLYMSIGQPTHI